MANKPYLSLVAASRNDNHGGNTLYRTQIFIDSFLEQCERYQLPAELILVEWNPPPDRAPLAEVISWVQQNEWVDCRVITVPYERHILLRFARQLPLFQMIAKNVGIRRARGEFILATNIDILFSNELMAFLAKKSLRQDRLYRCDRVDIDSEISKDISLDEKLQFARQNIVRWNYRIHPAEFVTPQVEGAPLQTVIDKLLETEQFELEHQDQTPLIIAKENAPLEWLHTAASGDFTLLHRDAWEKIRGYAEFEAYSLHIDTLGIVAAHLCGFQEAWLPPPAVCYHIEHSLGSGFTAEQQEALFDRLESQGITCLHYVIIEFFIKTRISLYNTEAWGLRDIPLEEMICNRKSIHLQKIAEELQAPALTPMSALQSEFDLAELNFQKILKYFENEVKKERAQVHVWIDGLKNWIHALQKRAKELEHLLEAEQTQSRLAMNAFQQALDAAEKRANIAETRLQDTRLKRCLQRLKLLKYFPSTNKP